MQMLIVRNNKSEIQSLGNLFVFDDTGIKANCKTLELPDKDNQRRISCFPEGQYTVVKRYSEKYGNHFHILDVPNRDYILIHAANYVRQLLGCVAVGANHTDIDGDGYRDVTSSRNTLATLYDIMPDSFTLKVIEL